MTNNEARTIIEEVIDTLIEVGNGVTDQDLHKECDKLLSFRNEYFNKLPVETDV